MPLLDSVSRLGLALKGFDEQAFRDAVDGILMDHGNICNTVADLSKQAWKCGTRMQTAACIGHITKLSVKESVVLTMSYTASPLGREPQDSNIRGLEAKHKDLGYEFTLASQKRLSHRLLPLGRSHLQVHNMDLFHVVARWMWWCQTLGPLKLRDRFIASIADTEEHQRRGSTWLRILFDDTAPLLHEALVLLALPVAQTPPRPFASARVGNGMGRTRRRARTHQLT